MACIYMYTNKLNGMKYIGQTWNFKGRTATHPSGDLYIDKALRKYGKANFELTILEDGIFDQTMLDKKEQYYIALYDTFNNGYNLTKGGKGGIKFDEKDGQQIIDMLKSGIKMQDIAAKTGYSVYTVSSINTGATFYQANIQYPIRNTDKAYHDDQVYEAIDMLKNTEFPAYKIAEILNTSTYFVYDVNNGNRVPHGGSNIQYPIRKNPHRANVTKEIAIAVAKLLHESTMSADQIGELVGLPGYTVGSINKGKHSACKWLNETYPIRKRQYRNKHNYSGQTIDLNKALDLLINTNLNLEEIAKRCGVTRGEISRINRGIVFQEELKPYKIPIRINQTINQEIFVSGEKE